MKTIFLTISLTSLLAAADTTTLTVEGMHCGGCKKMISEKVCEDETLKATIESCKVTLTDAKKQTGKIEIVTKKDAKLDLTKVKAGVTAAGDYKVTKEETK